MTSSSKTAGLLAAAFTVCVASSAAAANVVPVNPTFAKDILPIFEKSCQACHRPGQMAPFSLLTYDDARPWVRSIKNKVETRYMPPWHLDRTVGEYSPDPSLTDFEIATISKWVDNGAPRGDMNDAPAPIQLARGQHVAVRGAAGSHHQKPEDRRAGSVTRHVSGTGSAVWHDRGSLHQMDPGAAWRYKSDAPRVGVRARQQARLRSQRATACRRC